MFICGACGICGAGGRWKPAPGADAPELRGRLAGSEGTVTLPRMRVNSLGPDAAAAPGVDAGAGGDCHDGVGGVEAAGDGAWFHDGVGAAGTATGGALGGEAGGRCCAGTDTAGVRRSNNCVNSPLAFFAGGGGGATGCGRGVSSGWGGITESNRAAAGGADAGGADGAGGGVMPPKICVKLSPPFVGGGEASGGCGAGGMAAGVGGAAGGTFTPPNTFVKLSPPWAADGAGAGLAATGGAVGGAPADGGGDIFWNCRVNSPGSDGWGVTAGTGGTGADSLSADFTAPNMSVNDGVAGGFGGITSGEATAAGAKIAVKPPVDAAGGAGGVTAAAGSEGFAGLASMTSVLVSSTAACSRTHDGRSEKLARNRVTTTVVPSTSNTPSTCSLADGGSMPMSARRRCGSIALATSSVCTMTMRPSATSCAIWLRAPCSVSVFRTRYVAANSALVITWGQRVRYRRDAPSGRVLSTSQYIAIGARPSQHATRSPPHRLPRTRHATLNRCK